MRDENGVYSEEKAWNLIEELIKCSEVYFQYMNQRRDSEKEEEFLNFWLNETSKEFLRDFFYCVIRISETNAWRNKQGATQTFQDFITFSKQEYADECELYKDEVFADIMRTGDYHFVKGIFGRADFLVRPAFRGVYNRALFRGKKKTLLSIFIRVFKRRTWFRRSSSA